MKKFLSVLFLLSTSFKLFGQQFSQYNTGTLYDSFENPAQNAFIADTSRKYAFNFFVPNFNANLYLTGDAQVPLKNRAFIGRYNNDHLVVGQGRYNRFNSNFNAYAIMYRVFTSLDGNTEMGLSVQSRVEARGLVTDESIAIFDGPKAFPDPVYNNIFNDHATAQAYHQVSFNYREKLSKQAAIGVKVSALLGVRYQQLEIDHSSIAFNNVTNSALLSLQGRYRETRVPGGFTSRDIIPGFRNPGAAISIGTMYRTRDQFNIQANLKDLGFIHWNSTSAVYDFASSENVQQINANRREDNVYGAITRIIRSNGKFRSFVTPTNARLEVSGNKSFWIDGGQQFKYSPTFILSKELFYDGYTAALVSPFQYENYWLTVTTSYNNYKIFNLGTQLMVKSHNAEFYIGSDRLMESLSLASAARKNEAQINKNAGFTGADFFLGFSVKFGPVLEHPLNASYIPSEPRSGLFKRIYNRLFKRTD